MSPLVPPPPAPLATPVVLYKIWKAETFSRAETKNKLLRMENCSDMKKWLQVTYQMRNTRIKEYVIKMVIISHNLLRMYLSYG